MAMLNVLLASKGSADEALAVHRDVLKAAQMPFGARCAIRISRTGEEHQLIALADSGCASALAWVVQAAEALA